jgi:hypothetical protein
MGAKGPEIPRKLYINTGIKALTNNRSFVLLQLSKYVVVVWTSGRLAPTSVAVNGIALTYV